MRKPGMRMLLGFSLMLLLGGCDSSAGEVQHTPTMLAATPQPAPPTPTVLADVQNTSDILPGPPPTYDAAPRPDTHMLATARLLTSATTSGPVAGGGNTFWVEKRDRNQAIYGYNVATQALFTITSALKPDAGYGLLTDGQTVLWTESIITDENANPLYNIYGYDLRAQRPITLNIAPAARTDAYGLAFDNGTLFYVDNTSSHYGLYAQNIFSGRQRLISRCGGGPAAADGVLLWIEGEHGCSPPLPSNIDQAPCCQIQEKGVLHLLKLDGSKGDTVLTTSDGDIQYAVSGNKVVWLIYSVAQPISDEGVYLYDIGSGDRQRISSQAGIIPLIGDNLVAWNNNPTEQSPAWTVTAYDMQTGATSLAIKESNGWSQAHAIVGLHDIAYTMPSLNGESKIYLVSLP